MSFRHFVRYQLPVGLWIITIFLLSSIPKVPALNIPFKPDKIVHVGIYFVLCMFWRRALFHQERFVWFRDHALWVALGFTLLHGILDELYQLYVPGRWSDVYDVIADATGGLLFAGWFHWRRKRERNRGSI